MFCKKYVLKVSQNSQENFFAGVVFNKVAGLDVLNFIEKRLQHECFPVNFTKIFKITYFAEHLQTAASTNMLLKSKN